MTDKIDDKIVELLQYGGVGLLPTDTIYGLSGLALDEQAVRRIDKLKGRDSNKPFIVLISNIKMLDLLSISLNQVEAVKPYWPGALSVIFPAPAAPGWLQRGTGSLAVRLPDNRKLRDLITQIGPLISTSANIKGAELAASADEAQEIFRGQLDFYVDFGELDNQPSTLAAVKNGKLKVIRPGAVKIK